MANETLKIILTADNKQALVGLKQTVLALDGVSAASVKAGAAVAKTGKDFTGISRVIQDLPYGFNGIANNLTQLVPAAGLAGVAFSGLVTAITFASIGFGNWTRGITGAKKATQEMDIATKQLNQSIKEGNEQAAKSLASVSRLVGASLSETASYNQQLQILKQLNNESKEYFGNLSIENGKIKGLEIAYMAYANSILTVAKAKGASVQIEQLSGKLVDVSTQLQKAESAFQLTNKMGIVGGVEEAKNRFNELQSIIQGPYFNAIQKIGRLTQLTGKDETFVRDMLFKRNQLETERLRILGNILNLSTQIGKQELKNFETQEKAYGSTALDNILNQAKNRLSITKSLGQQQTVGVGSGADVSTQMARPGMAPTNPYILPEIRDSELRQENMKKEIALMQQQAATLTGLVTPAFEGLFNAFATGQPIGEALLDMFKQILIDLGKMVIKALIFKAILSALGKTNPLTAGMDLFGGAGGAIGGGLNIIGLLRGNDLALALDRTQTSYGYRRGG